MYAKMPEEIEIEQTIDFFDIIYHWWHINWEGGPQCRRQSKRSEEALVESLGALK